MRSALQACRLDKPRFALHRLEVGTIRQRRTLVEYDQWHPTPLTLVEEKEKKS
jgi:hypothetical protein